MKHDQKPAKRSKKTLSMPAARLSDILMNVPENGSPLRWGLAAAFGGPLSLKHLLLSEIGSGEDVSKKKLRSIDLQAELNQSLQQIDQATGTNQPPLAQLIDPVLWAYALPKVQELLGEAAANSLSGALEQLVHHCQRITDASSLSRLVGGGELGLVLAWRRRELIATEFIAAAVDCVKQWCESPEPSLGFAVRGDFCNRNLDSDNLSATVHKLSGSHSRAVLASLLRSKALCVAVAKEKLKKKPHVSTIEDLGAWVAAATRVGGTTAFSTANARDVRDDTVRGGLLDQMKLLDPKALAPAVDAAVGNSHTGGRIAWQISLPESFCHSELGGTAIMLPEWDVRRGRVHLEYGDDQVRIQLDAGKLTAVDGPWEVLIQVDGQEQAAAAPWTSLCEYTDDDVHYLELEQRWTGGIRLQRHLLLIREDRCVLLADAVIREANQAPAVIKYTSRLKLADGVIASSEDETTEVWLRDDKGKSRGLALSPQSSEWRVGPTRARFDVTSDGNLRLELTSDKRNGHGGGLFAPMWFDFQHSRFNRPRTWRQLTVAEDLRIVDPDESVAFRIQQGSEQWVVYRMLCGDSPRTFLGKHLLADLFCARFHASDGTMEDLVTVGGIEDDDEAS